MKDKQPKKKSLGLVLKNKGLAGIYLTLGKTKRLLDAETIQGIRQHLSNWNNFYEHWSPYVAFYTNYNEESIEKRLKDREARWKEDDRKKSEREYEVGEGFASFLELSFGKGPIKWADNGEAARVIKKQWAKAHPKLKDKLSFDPEASYCYIYTKDREVAKTFYLWSYKKIIAPYLKKLI